MKTVKPLVCRTCGEEFKTWEGFANHQKKHPRTLRAVIYPESKQIGCVLLQAIFGGDSHVCYMFDTRLWAMAPLKEKPLAVAGTKQEWMALAKKWETEVPKRAR